MSNKNDLRTFHVWISDSESGANQPIKVKARSTADAKKQGLRYIRNWNLEDGTITKIEEVS